MEEILSIGGKTYMASSSAAKATGYVPDYIGQLCRSGKVEALRVGRVWFVDVGSLSAYVEGDDSTMTSIVRKKCSLKNTLNECVTVPEISRAAIPIFIESTFAILICAVIFVGMFRFLLGHTVIAVPHLPSIETLSFFQGDVDNHVVSVASIGVSKEPIGSLFGERIAYGVYRSVNGIVSAARNFFGTVSYRTLVLFGFEKDDNGVLGNAMVVVPAAVNESDNEMLKEKIRESFSDPVNVSVGDDGTGIITPVFKSGKEDKYMFVMVPVTGE
jgi:hypothetical protein